MTYIHVQAASQPKPNILPGGDCGYCCLAGIMGITVLEAYDYVDGLRPHRTDLGKERAPLYSTAMKAVAEVWNRRRVGDDWDHNVPTFSTRGLRTWGVSTMGVESGFDWWPPPEKQPWGTPSWLQAAVWYEAVRWCLTNGYVLMTSIDFNGRGPSLSGDTNHAVLIVGVNEHQHPLGNGVSRTVHTVDVSCSVRGQWTENIPDFLFRYGGFHCHPFKV